MIKYYLENDEWDLKRSTDGASGFDLKANIGTERTIEPGQRWLISTGLFLEMPLGIAAMVCTRSGLAINHGIVVLNAPGIVDSDYRGEVKVSLINMSSAPYTITPGERIAQLLFTSTLVDHWENDDRLIGPKHSIIHQQFLRVNEKEALTDTSRGTGGHGSTGR